MTEPVTLDLRIDWSELDLFGHVNNVAFFKYLQASRVYCWEHLGMTVTKKENDIGVMLASSACTFIRPLFYPGRITINVTMSFIRNSSFGFHHQVLNENREIAAEADDVMVLFDFAKNEKVHIPAGLREKMEALLARDQA